jgi:origin recognition complex subunit 3
MQKPQSRQVIVAFQDSEGFDSSLLSDLLGLFHSWRDRIQFAVLFGVATSVELLRARLLKSTAHCLQGGQFDVVQAGSVLESVFKHAIAGTQARLRLGPGLLRTLVERQHDHVAGIQVFVSSIKYAYMCHFYANPLSMLLTEEDRETLQPEHLQAVRTLPSFRAHVEGAVEARQLHHAESLLENDEYLVNHIMDQRQERQNYVTGLLRSLHLITATGLVSTAFTDLYISALANGIDLSVEDDSLIESVRRLGPEEIVSLIRNLLKAVNGGSPDLDLPGWESDAEDLVVNLTEIQDEVEALIGHSKDSSRKTALKSKYSAQSKVLRTTVVAQKVQLSHDTATLSETDKAFTKAIDSLTDLLKEHISSVPIESLPVHEAWVYDAKSPYRDVFIPRPGITVERALSRPHDYLGCACCAAANGGVAPTMPATAILYHMYQETGALVNVADLWSAYFALVGQPDDSGDGEVEGGSGGMDERTALVHFYRALAELRTMGLVKPSKKKADHIAKLKWL